jgi:hypothetical protein
MFAAWMNSNLATQGYCLSTEDSRRLAVGLRFSTAVCLALVAVGIALQSAALLGALSVIGAIAAFARWHPFDHVWNHAVRHAFRAPPVPPNPARRRHGFKVATIMLLATAGLFAAGMTTAGIVLGVALLAACAAVTLFNFCIPSTLLALWDGRRHEEASTA